MPGLRVLVVEADATNSKLLVVILRAEGADARTASSAESALSLFPSFRPQLVITEVDFSGMDGLDLARQLRSADPNLTIVVVTSVNGPQASAAAVAAGADAYFKKPIDTNDFVTQLERVLNRKGTP